MSDSEDEYGPIDTYWGLQTSTPTTPNKSKGWDSLLDPNIKLGPNGLGAGNLHRKGKNFKPIDEEYILAQRLKKPIPKKSNKEESEQRNGNKSNKKKLNEVKGTRKTYQKPNNTLSTIRTPNPSLEEKNGASKWLQSSLVDEPFWEKIKEVVNDINNKETISTSRSNSLDKGFGIRPKPKVESVWTKRNNEPKEVEPSWGAVSKDIPAFEDKGWEKSDWETNNTTTENGWNVENTSGKVEWGTSEITNSGWGKVSNKPDWISHNNTNNNNNNIPPSKPSWLNSIPSQDNLKPSNQQHQQRQQSRFSNPSKQRYSENTPIDIPKPINYRSENTVILNTAPPPPPENNILITINVELHAKQRIPVDIRELDDPLELAKEFMKKNNVERDGVLTALTNLFSSQKELALKKNDFKLQRRTTTNQHRKYYPQNNFYNSSFPRQVAPVSPPPFTRKAYY